ncbi:hypothetical protein B0H17DRAFT_285452 [Mycena rosella]|uniref:C2H2-type domain-containing protein n=1 Tax=Mycena rosella TaxID=1033263 RepID=A0AAD7G8E0_MYCRO|nr:hypothetical protein B0H17DRAFT_285452 [Mycena rosella]
MEPLLNPKQQAAVLTVRAILASLEHDSVAQTTLAGSKMPDFAGDSLLDILRNISDSGQIPAGVAMPISRFLVTLAKSEALFGSLRHSDAPCLQLKRKREEADVAERASKRLYVGNHPLHQEVAEAVRVISHTLITSTILDPLFVASIQPQLHRVFLFAVSSSTAGGPSTNALQELSGLIQVLGVLSGIQIGQDASPAVLTAVHPCLAPGCGKVFARLYSLRAHAPAHAQKRTAWKCAACVRVFPRRNALKRHKTPSATRRPRDACVQAQVVEVEVTSTANGSGAEEGEIEGIVVAGIQETVLGLHAPLQAYVARALGQQALAPKNNNSQPDPTNGQATLASVIARAQLTQRRAAEAPPVANTANTLPVAPASAPPPEPTPSLSMYGLSDQQAKQLAVAIANAASAAQAEAEAQAALEEDEEDEEASDGPPDTGARTSISTPN